MIINMRLKIAKKNNIRGNHRDTCSFNAFGFLESCRAHRRRCPMSTAHRGNKFPHNIFSDTCGSHDQSQSQLSGNHHAFRWTTGHEGDRSLKFSFREKQCTQIIAKKIVNKIKSCAHRVLVNVLAVPTWGKIKQFVINLAVHLRITNSKTALKHIGLLTLPCCIPLVIWNPYPPDPMHIKTPIKSKYGFSLACRSNRSSRGRTANQKVHEKKHKSWEQAAFSILSNVFLEGGLAHQTSNLKNSPQNIFVIFFCNERIFSSQGWRETHFDHTFF